MNTKQIKGEINSIEMQIAELQESILGASFAGGAEQSIDNDFS